MRRNVFIESATDAGELKGGGTYTLNLSINNPIGPYFGNGDNYSVDASSGVTTKIDHNFIIGGGWCMASINGAVGGSGDHNVCTRSDSTSGYCCYALMADDMPDIDHNTALPDYITYDSNVVFQWNGHSAAVHYDSGTGDISLIHATFTNNLWDDPASGSNAIVAGHNFANAYTLASLLASISPAYTSLDVARADWIAHPEQHGWQRGVPLGLTGYGVATH